jgi:hypothetical protein
VLALTVLLVVAGGAITSFLLRAPGESSSTPGADGVARFEREKWLGADPEDGSREEMLDDLLQNHLKLAMPRKEVVKLLGEPGPGDKYPCLQPLPNSARSSLCYTVSLGLDPCTFLLGFDTAGRLVHMSKSCD